MICVSFRGDAVACTNMSIFMLASRMVRHHVCCEVGSDTDGEPREITQLTESAHLLL